MENKHQKKKICSKISCYKLNRKLHTLHIFASEYITTDAPHAQSHGCVHDEEPSVHPRHRIGCAQEVTIGKTPFLHGQRKCLKTRDTCLMDEMMTRFTLSGVDVLGALPNKGHDFHHLATIQQRQKAHTSMENGLHVSTNPVPHA